MRLSCLRAATVALCALAPTIADAQATPAPSALAQRIERIISRPEFAHAMWGIEFYSLDTHMPVYRLNADRLFTPASTTKLLTEGTALALLGADYRFVTRVYRTGPIRPDGTLDGDLVLVASGDPNLSNRIRDDGTLAFANHDHAYDADPATEVVPGDPLLVIRKLARQIAARGIRRIIGRVIVDASLFHEGERELGTGVVISPIVVNDNLVDVTITPAATAGGTPSVVVSPSTAYVRFVSTATTEAADSRTFIRWAADSELADGTHRVTIRGSMPAGGKPIVFAYAVPSPSRYAEITLSEALKDAGVSAPPRDAAAPPVIARLTPSYTEANVVAEHRSPPLSEEIKVTLKVSQNLHASMTPLLLGAIVGNHDRNRTGFDLEREFLTRAGLDVNGAQQSDGAGGDAHFTPDFMVSYLAYLASRPDSSVIYRALPVLGRDGTLWDIQTTSPAVGHVMAKTGTFGVGDRLNRRTLLTAKGLAGYLTTARGEHLAFAIYVNNVAIPDEPDAVRRIAGQAVGEVAAAAYQP